MRSLADLDTLIGRVPASVVTRLSAIDFGRGSEALYRDPADPNNASNPAMQLYMTQFRKYFPPGDKLNDPQDGIVAYGWTTAALLVKTLELSPKLDRGSVMETARTLKDVSGVGLQIPAAKWNTSADDWFVGETFQFMKYDATAKHTVPVGALTNEDGKTASLTPEELINQ